MLYILAFSCLFAINYSAPAATCGDQLGCLETRITETEDADVYEICIWFDTTKDTCSKEGSISHACDGQEEEDKDEWSEMTEMCQEVNCDGYAYFGVKDGRGCGDESPEYALQMSGVSGVRCYATDSADGGYCGGGNKQACTWQIPAPICEEPTYVDVSSTDTPSEEVDVECEDYYGTDECVADSDCCWAGEGCASIEVCDECNEVTCGGLGQYDCGEEQCCDYYSPPDDPEGGACQKNSYSQATMITAQSISDDNDLATENRDSNNTGNAFQHRLSLLTISVIFAWFAYVN